MVKRIIGNPTTTPMAIPDWKQDNPAKADFIKNKPTKLSEFDNDIGMQGGSGVGKSYVDEQVGRVEETFNERLSTAYETLDNDKANKTDVYPKTEIDNKEEEIWSELESFYYELDEIDQKKPDRIEIITLESDDILDDEGNTVFYHYMVQHTYTEHRIPELARLSIVFEDAEYDTAYMCSLSFDSGATPTSIDYTNSGILNWVGTDCTTADGLSIFQPSANTHYEIVFYFNGVQFIGLVNGFVPATGNEAV